MDTFITLTSLALIIIVPLGIVAGIRALAGNDDKATDLATFLAPLVASARHDRATTRPAVREDEPVRWAFA